MRIFIISNTRKGKCNIIKKCINCGIKIQIKEDTLKYKCPRCKTEYEYIDYVDIKNDLLEVDNVTENQNNGEQDNNS